MERNASPLSASCLRGLFHDAQFSQTDKAVDPAGLEAWPAMDSNLHFSSVLKKNTLARLPKKTLAMK